jgi:hypothetical protein
MTAAQEADSADDAEFMRIAARGQEAQAAFVASVERWSGVVHMPPETEAEQDRLFVTADTLRREAMSMPARTAVGLRAKARMVLDTIGLDDDDVLPSGDQDFPAWSLARDILNERGACANREAILDHPPASDSVSSDHELIHICNDLITISHYMGGDRRSPYATRQHALLNDITEMRALSYAGMVAKAQALGTALVTTYPNHRVCGSIAHSLMGDLQGTNA